MSGESMEDIAAVEASVGTAIARLREDMPKAFILVYLHGEGDAQQYGIITHCSLAQAQGMLPFAMEQMSHQYAVKVAKDTKP